MDLGRLTNEELTGMGSAEGSRWFSNSLSSNIFFFFFYLPQVKCYTFSPKYRVDALAGDGERSHSLVFSANKHLHRAPEEHSLRKSESWMVGCGTHLPEPRNQRSTERGDGERRFQRSLMPQL